MGAYASNDWVAGSGGAPAASGTGFIDAMNNIEAKLKALDPTYTKTTWANPTSGTPFTAEWMNNLEAGVTFANQYWAPPPSGGDDTAVLQTLINAAIDNSGAGPGVIHLTHGTYKVTGLSVQNTGFWMPRIIGRGRQSTIIKSANASYPVFEVIGSPGSFTQGELADLTIAGTDTSSTSARNGQGVQLTSCGGFQINRVQFTNLGNALRFYNNGSGAFTEFCVARDCNWKYCSLEVEYLVNGGNASFHGSGLAGNCEITTDHTDPSILINPGAFPYDAPMSATVFTSTPNTNIIRNESTGQTPSFFGTFRIENQTASPTVVASVTDQIVYYVGEAIVLGNITRLGNLYLCDAVYYTGSTVLPRLKRFTRNTTLAATTSQITADPMLPNDWFHISVYIANTAGTYLYMAVLTVFLGAGGGVTNIIDMPSSHLPVDTIGGGTPTFAISGNQLTVTNANAKFAGFSCTANVTPLGGGYGGDNLGQY